MASISIKEIKNKAEDLKEQGEEANRVVQSCQANIASASSRVAAAQRAVNAASRLDDEGHPVGDVGAAMAQLRIAEAQLEVSQRELEEAQEDVTRVRQEKHNHIVAIDKHNDIAKANMERLRQLQGKAFSENASPALQGMAERFNEAEERKEELLESMGESGHGKRESGSIGASGSPWKGLDFRNLNLSGELHDVQGNYADGVSSKSEGVNPSNSTAAPVGGGLSNLSNIDDNISVVKNENIDNSINGKKQTDFSQSELWNKSQFQDGLKDYRQDLNNLLSNSEIPDDLLGKITFSREIAENSFSNSINSVESDCIKKLVLNHKLSNIQRYEMGLRYIDNILDIYRDNLLDRGVNNDDNLAFEMKRLRSFYLKELSKDINGIENSLYVDPDFNAIESRLKNKSTKAYLVSDEERKKIRDGIRNGKITEKEIRQLGARARDLFEKKGGHQRNELQDIEKEQKEAKMELLLAKTDEEKKLANYKRKLATERENNYYNMDYREELVSKVIEKFRPIGTKGEIGKQDYYTNNSIGSIKSINAIENVRSKIPTDWVNVGNQRTIFADYDPNRGYYELIRRNQSDTDHVVLSRNDIHMRSCAFHEMSHRMEKLIPEIVTIERQFYERRTQNEPLASLGPGYGKDEKTRFDQFVEPYMGKDYGGGAYELLSMGMESLFCGTFSIENDQEYCDMLWGLLTLV